MAISLEGGAAGISYVIVPDDHMKRYAALNPVIVYSFGVLTRRFPRFPDQAGIV
jgi:hypothetical protein